MFLRKILPAMYLGLLLTTGCAEDLAHKVFKDPQAVSLAQAAASGDASRIRNLASQGANVNARGDQGTSLLQWSVLNKSPKGLAALLDAGANPTQADDQGETVMRYACLANDPVYLQVLLDHHVDPNTPDNASGELPLSSALLANRDQQFAMLLKAGADPSRTDRMGNTPLHTAAKINAFGHVLDLLKAGAPPTAINRQNATFQRYLFMTPASVLTKTGLDQQSQIIAWLKDHNIAIEPHH